MFAEYIEIIYNIFIWIEHEQMIQAGFLSTILMTYLRFYYSACNNGSGCDDSAKFKCVIFIGKLHFFFIFQ